MPRRTTPDPLALKVGKRVKQLREAAGLTMEQVAGRDLDKGHISGVERGLLVPNLHTLKAIADGLDVTMARLLEGI
jgi:transcriptional regulator with XRE-family HTH domain